MDRILIIDDDKNIRRQLSLALTEDYQVLVSEDGSDVLKGDFSDQAPELVLLDLHLPPYTAGPETGLKILSKLKDRDDQIKVVVVSGDGEEKVALKAIDLGAYDYLLKPFNLAELKTVVKRALYVRRLERENTRLHEELGNKFSFQNIVGNSPGIKRIFSLVKKIADTGATVLLTGENGTGKELIARAVHEESQRRNEPFKVINCGAIPENLLESELFGHERGSFTGAVERKIGKLEQAHHGTVFLDEIGELPLPLQVKLLRFLQEFEVERIGGSEHINLDVKVIAATNRNLQEDIKRGKFREDLFFRLNVITIDVPPLRTRGIDILLLAENFLRRSNRQNNRNIKGFTKRAKEVMMQYRWPGNVRELKNRIERAVILTSRKLISEKDLELDRVANIGQPTLKEAKLALEKEYITQALEKSGGNVTHAAESIGVNRTVFTRLIKRHGITNRKR